MLQRRKLLYIAILVAGWMPFALAQEAPFRPKLEAPQAHFAFVNAFVQVTPEQLLEHATILVEAGKIAAIGLNIKVPAGTPIVDLKSRYVYPSFIEPYGADFGKRRKKHRYNKHKKKRLQKRRLFCDKNVYTKSDIYSSFNAISNLEVSSKKRSKWRAAGYGAALIFHNQGLVQGTGGVISLADYPVQNQVIKAAASAHFSLDQGAGGPFDPRSYLKNAAFLRQMRLDVQWYAKIGHAEQVNLALAAIHASDPLPQIVSVPNKYLALRIHSIGKETNTTYVIKGAGDAYQRADEIAQTGATLILPLAYPKAPALEDPYEALNVSLARLKHWQMAPSNAAILAKKGVIFAFTAQGLKPKHVLKSVRQSIARGLPKATALGALTVQPARLLGVEDKLGTLEKGHYANFFTASADIFDDQNAIIYTHFIKGAPHHIRPTNAPDHRGVYGLSVGDRRYVLHVLGTPEAPKVKIHAKDSRLKYSAKLWQKEQAVHLSFHPLGSENEQIRLVGYRLGNDLRGTGKDERGAWQPFFAKYMSLPPTNVALDTASRPSAFIEEELLYPFAGFGARRVPVWRNYFVKGATLWTNEAQGRLEDADFLVENGKISALGKGLVPPPGAVLIDGRGKHLTAGIIDGNAKIAIFKGFFEANPAPRPFSSDLRMEDVLNPGDINIYRQLAAGVTVAQLLPPASMSIGGEPALIKLRWGQPAKGMILRPNVPFMTFSLQNDAQLEPFLTTTLLRARAYGHFRSKSKQMTNRDLKLEPLWEVLSGERLITCHTYGISALSMLIRVAEAFNLRINTFIHASEGYKVAKKIRKHGSAVSTSMQLLSSEAPTMPYHAALLQRAGVLVGIHSGHAEIGRRLPQEAAKAMKYGKLSQEEAWKTITLNPARILRLDARIGSLKVGKDADFVLWSENPLSAYAKVEKTFIDGACYYDISADLQKRVEIAEQRSKIAQSILAQGR